MKIAKYAIFSLLMLVFQCAIFTSVKAARPNIIFLLADDQCCYSMGCYGNPDVKTPNMDKLARDGVIFDRHYVTTAICMASRATIMTGMYEYKHGTNFSHGNMKPEVWKKSYPVLLRKAGYMTAFAGKFGFEVEGMGLCKDDFDHWGGGPGQTSYKTADNKSMAKYAKKYPHSTLSYGGFGQDVIKAAAKGDKPFCLSISFKAPHRPVKPDPKFDEVYTGKKFVKPNNFGREHGKHMSEQSKQDRQWERFTSWGYSDNYDEVMAQYNEQIYGIDVALGMIREELERQDLAGNTVIIYTSDNGFICGSHGYGSKVLPMEESARVPLIIYDPGSKSAGSKWRCKELTGSIDFAPTILKLAGVSVPGNMDGIDLANLLGKPGVKLPRQDIVLINAWGKSPTWNLSVVSKDWKYTYWWYRNDKMEPVEDLYDMTGYRLELKNFAGNQQQKSALKQMRKRYDHHLQNWKQQAVDYNDYQRFGTLFDRTTTWQQKVKLIKK